MKNVYIFTDGSTYPTNPGRGGIGFVLFYKDSFENEYIRSVGLPLGNNTTNNYAESIAVLTALHQLKRLCKISLITDSQYVIYGMKRILQPNKKGLLETNITIWQDIKNYLKDSGHEIRLQKVTAHSGENNIITQMNKLADKLAGYSARTGKKFDRFYYDPADAYDDRPTKTTE